MNLPIDVVKYIVSSVLEIQYDELLSTCGLVCKLWRRATVNVISGRYGVYCDGDELADETRVDAYLSVMLTGDITLNSISSGKSWICLGCVLYGPVFIISSRDIDEQGIATRVKVALVGAKFVWCRIQDTYLVERIIDKTDALSVSCMPTIDECLSIVYEYFPSLGGAFTNRSVHPPPEIVDMIATYTLSACETTSEVLSLSLVNKQWYDRASLELRQRTRRLDNNNSPTTSPVIEFIKTLQHRPIITDPLTALSDRDTILQLPFIKRINLVVNSIERDRVTEYCMILGSLLVTWELSCATGVYYVCDLGSKFAPSSRSRYMTLTDVATNTNCVIHVIERLFP